MSGRVELAGLRILVVEDDFFIAMDMAELLRSHGAEVLGPIGRVDEAVAFVEEHHGGLDAVVLDMNLHGLKTYPVADALIEQGVPFVFTTGYSADAVDLAYREHPRCEKPVNTKALLHALTR
ncbi:response regulator [Plastoroseomonas arctica]|uniref:Response regulator n=1 Tax=Plastoroseomonas arctica TaxID=1509237 RepID=A0AAF1JUR9_9PROT|nr:response regulator [Plastoroseomonas arctica]MBR0653914.1 response regulator [Plastoroseomonas arctica]